MEKIPNAKLVLKNSRGKSPQQVELVGTRDVDKAHRKQLHAPTREERPKSSGGTCAHAHGRMATQLGWRADRRSLFLLNWAVTANSHSRRYCVYLSPISNRNRCRKIHGNGSDTM
ncbi:hypothetical protein JCGZ_22795 [Jatropha curcas]|uniref:Uncharacterized protein n=1 Tax=Jatropha curcas TaxID=180498 RepID=A0A067L7R6_JATCU|nr:hypothetical protein JCGZ_22795 [Jatropha curcas]